MTNDAVRAREGGSHVRRRGKERERETYLTVHIHIQSVAGRGERKAGGRAGRIRMSGNALRRFAPVGK